MKGYQTFFIFMRAMVILQAILIVFKKQTKSSDIYIVLEAISKISVGAFLYLFFLLRPIDGLEYGDVLILQFAGILIMVDVNYGELIGVIRKYFPFLPKVPFIEEFRS
jgi:hypothetical protein